MKIYIVSCSPPRVERLLKAAAPLNLVFEVVESPLGTDKEVQRRGKRCIERGTGYATGIAATIGHIRAMERIASREDPLAIIIEDDVRFHKKFNEYLPVFEKYMIDNPSCDIFSLGFLSVPRKINSFIYEGFDMMENVYVSNPWGAQCYIITKLYAKYFSTLFSKDDLSVSYSGNFVTDCVIFDPIINCKRSSLIIPIAIEDPSEQTLAGNNNKPPIQKLGVSLDDFFLNISS